MISALPTPMRGDLDRVKEARQKSVENLKERNSINWYTVVVFETEAEHDEFMKKISIPKYEKYITEDQLMRIKKK